MAKGRGAAPGWLADLGCGHRDAGLLPEFAHRGVQIGLTLVNATARSSHHSPSSGAVSSWVWNSKIRSSLSRTTTRTASRSRIGRSRGTSVIEQLPDGSAARPHHCPSGARREYECTRCSRAPSQIGPDAATRCPYGDPGERHSPLPLSGRMRAFSVAPHRRPQRTRSRRLACAVASAARPAQSESAPGFPQRFRSCAATAAVISSSCRASCPSGHRKPRSGLGHARGVAVVEDQRVAVGGTRRTPCGGRSCIEWRPSDDCRPTARGAGGWPAPGRARAC